MSTLAVTDGLFEGLVFYLVQRVPQRSRFIEDIKRHGGEIARLEKFADVIIADHLRKDSPPGSISYTWIEQSVKDRKHADQQQHLAGPPAGAVRPIGSARPAKTSKRAFFSAEDDKVLYKWVRDAERNGAKALGNELYKQLERVNNAHPWQSWRDRYVKYVRLNPPALDTSPPASDSPEPAQRQPSTHSAVPSRDEMTPVPDVQDAAISGRSASPRKARFRMPPEYVDLSLEEDAAFPSTAPPPAVIDSSDVPEDLRDIVMPPSTAPVYPSDRKISRARRKLENSDARSDVVVESETFDEPRVSTPEPTRKRRKLHQPRDELPMSQTPVDSLQTSVHDKLTSQAGIDPELETERSAESDGAPTALSRHRSHDSINFNDDGEPRLAVHNGSDRGGTPEQFFDTRTHIDDVSGPDTVINQMDHTASDLPDNQLNDASPVHFSHEDRIFLRDIAHRLLDSDADEPTWHALALEKPHHTAEQWRDFFQQEILPLFDNQAAPQTGTVIFDEDDERILLFEAKALMNVSPERMDEAFDDFAQAVGKGTGPAWRQLYEEKIHPIALKLEKLARTRDSLRGYSIGSTHSLGSPFGPVAHQPSLPDTQLTIGRAELGNSTTGGIEPEDDQIHNIEHDLEQNNHLFNMQDGSLSAPFLGGIAMPYSNEYSQAMDSVLGDLRNIQSVGQDLDINHPQYQQDFRIHQDLHAIEEDVEPEFEQENPDAVPSAGPTPHRHHLGRDQALPAFSASSPIDFKLMPNMSNNSDPELYFQDVSTKSVTEAVPPATITDDDQNMMMAQEEVPDDISHEHDDDFSTFANLEHAESPSMEEPSDNARSTMDETNHTTNQSSHEILEHAAKPGSQDSVDEDEAASQQATPKHLEREAATEKQNALHQNEQHTPENGAIAQGELIDDEPALPEVDEGYDDSESVAPEADSQNLPMGTQAFFNADTLQPDYDLPLPDDDSDDGNDNFSDDDIAHAHDGLTQSPEANATSKRRSESDNVRSSSTSPIVNMAKQRPNSDARSPIEAQLSSPLSASQPARRRRLAPPRSQSSPNNPPKSTSATKPRSKRSEPADIDQYIQTMKRQGHDEKDIIQAIFHTSNDPDLVPTVLKALENGQRLPKLAGIWSVSDDKVFVGVDARHMRRVEQFHGTRRFNERRRLLGEWGWL